MLVRLPRASRSAGPVTQKIIEPILEQSRRHDPERGVTGILCHGGDVSMHVVEGGRDAVNRLYGDIVRDGRHRDVALLHCCEVPERRFANWTMGQVNLAKPNPSRLLKYPEKPVLVPCAVSGQASMAMLEELIDTAQLIGRAG